MSEAPPRSNASLLLGLAVAVALALGVGLLVYRRQEPPPPPPTSADEAPASPAPTEAVQPEPPSSLPAGAPAADAGANQAMPAPGKPPVGPGPHEKPAAGGGRGTAGAPPPLSAQALMRRSFAASRTAAENVKGATKDPAGFDAKKAKDLTLKRAPEVDGRIEFSTTPSRVRPGDSYKVIVSFVNEGKRSVDVEDVTVVTTVNGQETSSVVKPLAKSVASNQNEALYELTGTWDKATTSWRLEVRLTSGRQDVYRNSLVWK